MDSLFYFFIFWANGATECHHHESERWQILLLLSQEGEWMSPYRHALFEEAKNNPMQNLKCLPEVAASFQSQLPSPTNEAKVAAPHYSWECLKNTEFLEQKAFESFTTAKC